MTSNLARVLKAKKTGRNSGKYSTSERENLENMYTSGPAAYGSARNLLKTSKMSKAKVETLLQQKMPKQNTDKFNVRSIALK